MNSSQFGDPLIVLVICALSDLSEGLEDVSIRITSWRFEGGRVKRTGMLVDSDILEVEVEVVVRRVGIWRKLRSLESCGALLVQTDGLKVWRDDALVGWVGGVAQLEMSQLAWVSTRSRESSRELRKLTVLVRVKSKGDGSQLLYSNSAVTSR
jgi:hypothetical protein